MHTLDTNSIIYYLSGEKEVILILDDILKTNTPVYISSITEVELFSFSGLNFEDLERIENLLKTLSIIPLDSNIARISGFLRRSYKLHTADSIIAATAMFTGSTLITRNIKHFNKIPDLSIQKI